MTKANKGGSDILREILRTWDEGKEFQVRDLYNEYLTYVGPEDEKIGEHTIRYFLGGPGLAEGLIDKILSKTPTSKGKTGFRRAIGYKVTRPKTEEEEPQITKDDVKDMAESLQPNDTQLPIDNLQLTDPGIVTDSQIGKSMIYYVDELKQRLADLGKEMDDQREKLTKTIQDLRDSLASSKKELDRERSRANNLQIALNRMRNAPPHSGNTKTFNLGEIATIKR